MLTTSQSLNRHSAATLCQAACDYAEQQGLKICAWVVDRHGNPLAMQRIEHTALPSSAIAKDKANTALSFGFGTHLWTERLADKPHLQLGLAQRPGVVLFGGGLAIKHQGELVGAIGVSGASEAQDQDCAAAAVAALAPLEGH